MAFRGEVVDKKKDLEVDDDDEDDEDDNPAVFGLNTLSLLISVVLALLVLESLLEDNILFLDGNEDDAIKGLNRTLYNMEVDKWFAVTFCMGSLPSSVAWAVAPYESWSEVIKSVVSE